MRFTPFGGSISSWLSAHAQLAEDSERIVPVKCPTCGGEIARNRVWTHPYRSRVILRGHSDQCLNCGTGVPEVAGELEEALKRTITRALLYKPARLEAWEVRFLRSDVMHLASQELALHMGVWSSAVSRWESARAPQEMGEAPDRLLRLLVVALSRLALAEPDFLTKLPSKERQEHDPTDLVEKPDKPPHIVCSLVEGNWDPEWWSGNRRIWRGREGNTPPADDSGSVKSGSVGPTRNRRARSRRR